ncbi:THUMP domain-containing protein 1 homolog [Diaphorina citri]|uniref:THUMP domain-containing protein 1 homolog n=1 Tax=Diaphorina citri TaxID=121845 RepID=A0A3Q0JC44_DIACI|nr:THUMP domain-containing protein 1 homolog [Diaphorina citri]
MGKDNGNKYHPYKKHNHNKSKNTNSGTLPIGVKGFLCTFNTMKKNSANQCAREAFNILNEYLEKSQSVEHLNEDKPNMKPEEIETAQTNTDELDIEDELKSELNELKNDDNTTEDKIPYLAWLGAQGNMFIKINDKTIDPVTLGTSIVEDLYTTKQQKTVNLLRLVPIEVTCKSYLDDITKAIGPLLDKYFSGEPTSYCIVFNRRNNNNLERSNVIEFIALLVKEKNMFHTVDLKQAALTIVIEVIKSVCCISVLPHYYKYKKYNLSEITYPEDKVQGDSSKDVKTQSNDQTIQDQEEVKQDQEDKEVGENGAEEKGTEEVQGQDKCKTNQGDGVQ